MSRTLRFVAASSALALVVPVGVAASAQAAAPAGAPAPKAAAQVPAPRDCLTSIPEVGPRTWNQVRHSTSQVIVSRGEARNSMVNQFEAWDRVGGCWTQAFSYESLNGAYGWSETPRTGSYKSPIGVFSLTDAGGRLPNPGTSMRYHYGPQSYGAGGYKLAYPVQIFNYVIAINFNRKTGQAPRNLQTLKPNVGSGYWIHQRGLGATKGCLSLTKGQMVNTMRWIKRSAKPQVIMGPQSSLNE